jgi:hypothetical protein
MSSQWIIFAGGMFALSVFVIVAIGRSNRGGNDPYLANSEYSETGSYAAGWGWVSPDAMRVYRVGAVAVDGTAGIAGALTTTWVQASAWATVQSQLPDVARAWVSRADDRHQTVTAWTWEAGAYSGRSVAPL